MIRQLPLPVLEQRAKLRTCIREYLSLHNFVEVETPQINPNATPEPFIDSFTVKKADKHCGYLITSPEFNLKTLIAGLDLQTTQDPPDGFFELTRVFRQDPHGPQHTAEFVMLELYRLKSSMNAFISFLENFFSWLAVQWELPHQECFRISLETLFLDYTGLGFSFDEIKNSAVRTGRTTTDSTFEELFHTVFLEKIEPAILERSKRGPVFIYGYPPALAAYSKIESGTAKRFECYWNGLEIANGYEEVTDWQTQKERFEQDNTIRKQRQKPVFQPDPDFEKAMKSGLPDCSGVAVGFERLLMVLTGAARIEEISPFKPATNESC